MQQSPEGGVCTQTAHKCHIAVVAKLFIQQLFIEYALHSRKHAR